MTANDINFLPDSYRARQRQRRAGVRVYVASVLIAACLVAWAASQRGGLAEMSGYAATAEAELHEARSEATLRGRLRARLMTLTRQAGVRAELVQSVRHTQVLAVIGELLPEGVGLLELEIVARRPEPAKPGAASRSAAKPGADDERLELTLTGFAPDDVAVNDTIARLAESPLFQKVALGSSREDRREGLVGRRFTVGMRVDLGVRYVDARGTEAADAG